ncbi:MAG: hypothetical protein WC613_05765 [Candidatus Aenigmatarchaeota archaeon]
MKQYIILISTLLAIIFIAGCTNPVIPPEDKPYIKSIEVQNAFIHMNSQEKATIGFVVYNPLQVTFTGKAEIQFQKPNCFQTWSSPPKSLNVSSKTPLPFTIDVYPTQSSDTSCVGTHSVSVTISDINGDVLDTRAGEVNIVQR